MRNAKRTLWISVVVYGLLLALCWAGTAVLREGPSMSSLDFDAGAALKTAQTLIPDGRPHPSGSLENREVADRIVGLLSGYGYQVERQAELYCTALAPGCTQLENVLAVKEGRRPGGEAILVTAHYDSVPGGPGAGDDIAGVAALLEIARRLQTDPPLLNDVIFLFADAEEAGLRGAQAFVENNPLMQRVKLVINVEARGVAGPSQMFETSVGNAALLGLFSETASRPVASSLMYEAYRRMPNNTDLTIYKKAGAMGINFAFSRGVALYHSSRDDLEHLSPVSVAHHGDNVLHFLRQAGDTELTSLESTADASYVDLFGTWLIDWPAAANLPAAALALLLILLLAGSQGALRFGPTAGSIGLVVLLLVAHVALGWLLSWPLARWPGIHALDHPHPAAGNLALFAGSVLLTLLFSSFAARRIDRSTYLFASWAFFALLSCLLAGTIAGAAYIVLIPSAGFALAAVVERSIRGRVFPVVAAWIGTVLAVYMAVYHFIFMDVLTSFYAAWLKMVPLGLAAIASSPLFSIRTGDISGSRRPIQIVSAVFLAATIAAALVPAYSENRPRSLNIAYQQIGGPEGAHGESRSAWRMFTFGPPDRAYAAAAGFPAAQENFQRWGLRDGKAYLLDSPSLDLAPPVFILDTDRTIGDTRTLKGSLQSGRSGFLLGLTFKPGSPVNGLEVEGKAVLTGENYMPDKGASVTFSGIGDRALEIELEVPANEPVELIVFELSAFPNAPEGEAITGLRPSNAAPIHFSDHTEIQNHYRF